MSRSRACPFCKGTVPDDVFLHGGNCPHCMLEIPGEEAPTDPGAEMRARLEAEARVKARKAQRRAILLGGVALFAAMGLVTVAAAWWKERQAAMVYDLPEEYYIPTPLEMAALQPTVTTPAAQASDTRVAKNTTRPKDNPTTPTGAQAPTSPTSAAASPTGRVADPPPPDIVLPATSGGITGIDVKVSGGFDQVLTDDADIRAMAAKVASAYKPQVDGCFRSALALASDIKGLWTVTFTITPEGHTKNVAIEAAGTRLPSFEACVVHSVSAWKFLRIDHDFNVRKKFNYSGSE